MPKTLTCNGKGLLGINSINRILPQSRTRNQVISELLYYINRSNFTDSLELLERCGITSDVALFIWKNLQTLGRRGKV